MEVCDLNINMYLWLVDLIWYFIVTWCTADELYVPPKRYTVGYLSLYCVINCRAISTFAQTYKRTPLSFMFRLLCALYFYPCCLFVFVNIAAVLVARVLLYYVWYPICSLPPSQLRQFTINISQACKVSVFTHPNAIDYRLWRNRLDTLRSVIVLLHTVCVYKKREDISMPCGIGYRASCVHII